MSVRRNIKNVVYNYSEAARKAREATSNDPWGPSTSLMQELADLTYNMAAYNDIMPIVWKRLNDHGKNWRHVYKSLVLLDYLVRYGSKRITQQCKENIFVIQTLKDFQYIEGNRDQGQNVREKAKQLVALLKDDERLKNERAKAEALKHRMMQDYTLASSGRAYGQANSTVDSLSSRYELYPRASQSLGYGASGFYQDGSRTGYRNTAVDPAVSREYAAPKDAEEEAMQVQLALALSKEQADEEERQRKSDFIKMSLAVDESLKTNNLIDGSSGQRANLVNSGKNASENDLLSILDGLSIDQNDSRAANLSHMVNRPVSANPWISQPNANSQLSSDDVWGIPSSPWTPFTTGTTNKDIDAAWNETRPIYSEEQNNARLDSYDLYNLTGSTASSRKSEGLANPSRAAQGPDALMKPVDLGGTGSGDYFLGEHAPLVDLNNLTASDYNLDHLRSFESGKVSSMGGHTGMGTRPFSNLPGHRGHPVQQSSHASNPFVLSSMTSPKPSTNPFVDSAAKPPTLNQLSLQSRNSPSIGFQTANEVAASEHTTSPASHPAPGSSSTLPPPLVPTGSKPSSPFNAS